MIIYKNKKRERGFNIYFKFFLVITFCFFYSNFTDAQSSTACQIGLNNGFEIPVVTTGVGFFDQKDVPNWTTTAVDGMIEIWQSHVDGIPAYEGNQFAELNANFVGTLIKTFNVRAGTPLLLKFAHRGRQGVDVMRVDVGPVGGPYTSLGNFSDDNTAWGAYSSPYTPTVSGPFQLRFVSVSATGGDPSIGNFLDAVDPGASPILSIISTPPEFSCSGNNIVLDGSSSSSGSNIVYSWTTVDGNIISGANTTNAVISKPGTYTLTVTNSALGCTDNSSVTVNGSALITPSFNAVAPICSSSMSNPLPSKSNEGITGTWSPAFNNTATTTYTFTPAAGQCASSSTTLSVPVLLVTKKTPINIIICKGKSYSLPSGRVISSAGLYQDTLRYAKGCDSIITTVSLQTTTYLHASYSLSVCVDSSINVTPGANFDSYNWNTGANVSTLHVSEGIYWVNATSANDCDAKDTFNIAAYAPPTLTLNKNILLCSGQSTTIDAGAGYQSYLWNTGSTNQTISIKTVGKYFITVRDNNGCPASDTTIVSTIKPTPSGFLPSNVIKSNCVPIMLMAQNNYATYLWNTGSITNAITVKSSGKYILKVIDINGCVGADSTTVTDTACVKSIYVPSAFSPNGDQNNDRFKPLVKGTVLKLAFEVYNRWGQKMYSSSTLDEGWDGTINGIKQPIGTYIWYLSVTLSDGIPQNKKGTVLLLR